MRFYSGIEFTKSMGNKRNLPLAKLYFSRHGIGVRKSWKLQYQPFKYQLLYWCTWLLEGVACNNFDSTCTSFPLFTHSSASHHGGQEWGYRGSGSDLASITWTEKVEVTLSTAHKGSRGSDWHVYGYTTVLLSCVMTVQSSRYAILWKWHRNSTEPVDLPLMREWPSLMPRPHLSRGKQSGEPSQISSAYYQNVVRTNESTIL